MSLSTWVSQILSDEENQPQRDFMAMLLDVTEGNDDLKVTLEAKRPKGLPSLLSWQPSNKPPTPTILGSSSKSNQPPEVVRMEASPAPAEAKTTPPSSPVPPPTLEQDMHSSAFLASDWNVLRDQLSARITELDTELKEAIESSRPPDVDYEAKVVAKAKELLNMAAPDLNEEKKRCEEEARRLLPPPPPPTLAHEARHLLKDLVGLRMMTTTLGSMHESVSAMLRLASPVPKRQKPSI